MYDIVLGRTKGDLKKYGKKGSVLIGKQYVQMGQTSSLSNPIYMDVARAHAMLICGKRGGGKCLSGETKVLLDSGELVKIKNLNDNSENVCSLNLDYKFEKVNKTEFYKRKVKILYNLALRSGRNIKLTPEHPLLTVNSWEKVKNLDIGSRIATPRYVPIEGKEKIGMSKVRLLAYLIAEGHLDNGFILFTNKDESLVNDFVTCVKNFDSSLLIRDHGNFSYRVVQNNKREIVYDERDLQGRFLKNVKFNSKSSLRIYLESLGLYSRNSFTKFIPDCVFKSPNSEIKEFLKVLFSCDGSIYKEKANYWKISYSSVSKNIIESVQHLLLRFGIISKFREKKTNFDTLAYELEIKGVNVENFAKLIGFFGEKERKQELMLKSAETLVRNSNLDTIPKEIWNRYLPEKSWTEIGKKLGYKHPKSLRESTRYSPTREKLSKISLVDENLEINNLANSDIYWDEIVSIDKLVGNFEVYDITVPSYNNFLANDIVVHNSYTMGSIAEGLADMDPEVAQNLAFVLLDTMGVYWSMKYPNRKDDGLLKDWGIEGKGLDVIIYTPGGFFKKYKEDGIPVDFPLYIRPNELSVEDWMNAFKLKTDDVVGVAVQRVINKLIDSGKNYSIDDVLETTEKDSRLDEKTKLAVINRFENCKTWGIFSKNATKIKDLLSGGKVTVLDLSPYVSMPGGWEVKSLALGIIAKKIFVERMLVRKREELFDIVNKTQVVKKEEVEDDIPMPWLIIDEAHEFLPNGETVPSTQALMTILREGRQPGVSLILATQQPGKIHTDAITQSDIVLSHRITASFDLEALDKIFLSYDSKGSKNLFNSMPRVKGCAIIMDDKNERLHTMQVKPRTTWHGGEDPNAIREIHDEFDFD